MTSNRETDLTIRNQASGNRSGLPNQGQIDWIALANTTFEASVGLLSRMSNAGVEPFTIAVGQAVAKNFRMSTLGIHRVGEAIKNLRCVPGIGEALWFGFGINHILRNMNHTVEGSTCIMLCSALSETRSITLSARVLYELTETYKSSSPEATMTPSLQQWESIIKVSAGCLASTPFGTVVGQMVDLMHNRPDINPREMSKHRARVGKPQDVAKVLNALARLSVGQITTLTISGSCDCGWVAAVAHWFFDIIVEIHDQEGQTVYPLGKPTAPSQRKLIVVLAPDKPNTLQVVSVAYQIADVTRDIIAGCEPDPNVASLLVRLPWRSVLQQTFGKQASTLIKMLEADLGTAIGSAARIFSEYVKAQTDKLSPQPFPESDLSLSLWYGHGSASYGQGFLHFVCKTFPELESLQETMEDAAQKSFSDAVAQYQSAHVRLRSTCGCQSCKSKAAQSSDVPQSVCLPLLCKFVIRLALDLSVTSVPSSILPTRSGLEEVYYEYYMADASHKDGVHDLLTQMKFESAQAKMLTVFTGFRTYPPARDISAIVKYGLCLYVGVLRGLSDMPEEMARIHIVPGRIETRAGRTYDKLIDSEQYKTPLFNYKAGMTKPSGKLPDVSQHSTHNYEVQSVVQENVSSLTTYCVIEKDKQRSAICSPMSLVSQLLRSCGWNRILCNRRDCPSLDISGLSVATIHGEGEFQDSSLYEIDCRVGLRIVDGDPIARLLALFVEENRSRSLTKNLFQVGSDGHPMRVPLRPKAIMQRDQCLPCVIRTAVKLSQGDNYYIVCR